MTHDKTSFKDILSRIREPRKLSAGRAAAGTAASALTGIILGVFSKWLDNLALDSGIWWHRTAERLGLGIFFSDMAIWLLAALIIAVSSASARRAALNVFVFFTGMCAAYHIWTIVFSGFDPGSYMMIWYGLTVVSPLLAVLCWYAKGKGIPAVVISCLIMAVFTLSCFSLGWIYLSPRGILYILTFIAAAAVLYRSPKQTAISLPAGLVLAFLLLPLYPFR